MSERDRSPDVCSSELLFYSSRRRHPRFDCDWSSDVCSSELFVVAQGRIGTADRIGNGELALGRTNLSRTTRLTGYKRLAASNDWGEPLSFRSSMAARSEERRVGEEGRSRWSPYH